MSSSEPLTGVELVDCARANAKQGIDVATDLCGYGTDINRFQQALRQACDHMGIKITELSELIADQPPILQIDGVGGAPAELPEL